MSNRCRSFTFGPFETSVTFGTVSSIADELEENTLLVCDRNTEYLAGPFGGQKVVLPPGEENKSWDSIEQILRAAISAGFSRDSVFLGLGGGVVCDMAAFAASVFMRGSKSILVPTTMLAMVDASIGGKTGIDYAGYKNLVGSFYPALRVHIAVESLATLPEREYRSGLAEVIKHALLGAEDLLEYLEKEPKQFLGRDDEAVEMSISRSLDIKGDIVVRDYNEQGVRAFLNFGHTFAHALESAAGFGVFSHGEAVAWGIDRALTLGAAIGITDKEYAARVRKLLQCYGYRIGPLPEHMETEAVLAAMKQDKKKRAGDLQFVLQQRLGETLVTALDEKVVKEVLENDQLS